MLCERIMTLSVLKGILICLIISISLSQVTTSDLTERFLNNFSNDVNDLKFKNNNVSTLYYRQPDRMNCIPTVILDGCNTNESTHEEWQWSRLEEYHILAVTTRGCTNTTLSYNWKLTEQNGRFVQDFPEFENKSYFVLRYFTVEIGLYYLHVQVIENYNDNEAIAKCLITIVDDNLEAKKVCNELQMVVGNSDIVLQGNMSINSAIASEKEEILDSKKNNIIVPSRFATHGPPEYTFNSKVKSFAYRDSETEKTTEKTRAKSPEASASLECMKNCNGSVNSERQVYIHSWCRNCKKYRMSWDVRQLIKGWEVKEGVKRYGTRLFIDAGILWEEVAYIVRTTYTSEENHPNASLTFTVAKRPYVKKDCTSTRDVVSDMTKLLLTCRFTHYKSLSTKFFIKYEGSGSTYLVDWGTAETFGIILPGKLPSPTSIWHKYYNTDIQVYAFDSEGLETRTQHQVEILYTYMKFHELESIVNGTHKHVRSVESLMDKQVQTAIQTVHAICAEMRIIHDKSKHIDLQFAIFTSLNKSKLRSSDEILGITGALRQLYQVYNRTYAAEVMDFAKRLANKQLEFIMTCNKPYKQEIRSAQIAQALVDLTSLHRNSMRGELQKENLVFNILQYFPKMNIKVITEDYPNYDDFEFDYVDLVKPFIKIIDDMEEANQRSGLQLAMTLATGEFPREYSCTVGNRFKVRAGYAYTLALEEVGFWDTSIFGSLGIKPFGSDRFLVVLVVYTLTPYWWLDEFIFQSENMLTQTFYSEKNQYNNFDAPTEQFFTSKSGGAEFYKGSVTMPHQNLWTDNVIDEKMTVHRVSVQKSAGLLIIFNNLGNNKLRVVLKHNSRPSYMDVKSYQVVSKDSNTISSGFPEDQLQYGDAWLYIAILPELSKSRSHRATIRYEVGFLSPVCFFLNKEDHKWQRDPCVVGPKVTMKRMHCLCKNQGHYAYQYIPVLYKLDSYFKPLVKLAISVNFMVMFLIFSIFACYCIALCFAINSTRRRVYFASDNLISELYGYLIIIKTGEMINSGTTSNIGIKLFGKTRRCRSHMLNYPDPDKRLLQKGSEDWFVITTESYLGDLDHIYLWHDSVGIEPSWYCDWIRIKDLQLRHEWFFQVQKWFCVIKGDANYVSLEPKDEIQDTNAPYYWVKRFFVNFRYYHTWNIFKKYQGYDLTYIERITLVLSAIYTTMLVTLVFYGMPRLNIYDGFTEENFKFDIKIFKIAAIASVISFLFHLLFTILFRTKNYNVFRVVSFDLVWLGWALITLHVVVCMTFLVYYGIWVAYITGIAYILSVIVALLISIFILEAIYILFKLRRAKIPKVAIDSVQVIKEIENQREGLYPRFGNNMLVPYLAQKYRPQTREEWLQKRQKEIRREEIARQLYDLIMFLIFIILLYFIVFSNKDDLDVYSHIKMKQMMSGYFTKAERFDKIANISDFQEYLNGTLALATQPAKWYSDFNLIDPGIMIDYCTKVLGVVKLRQLRVCEDCCTLVKPVANMSWTCNPEYRPEHTIIGEYQEFWKNKTNETETETETETEPETTEPPPPEGRRVNTAVILNSPREAEEPDPSTDWDSQKRYKVRLPRLMSVWAYEDEPIPTSGYITNYLGGGYSAPLGRQLYNTYYNIKYLVDNKWFDNKSRVHFVEFLTYNPNYNIFNDVKLLLEQSSIGLWVKSYQIYTFRLFFVNYELEAMVALIAFAFMVMVAFFIFNYCYYGMSEEGFWRHGWNYVDLLIIILSVTCVIKYRERLSEIETVLINVAKAQHNEIVFYDNLRYIDEIVIVLTALLIGLATIRIWKILRFGKRFRIMEETTMHASKPLLAVFVSHLIIIFIYTCIGYIVFGSQFRDFRNFTVSLSTILLLTVNLHKSFYFEIMQNYHNSFVYYYYFTYILCSFVLIVLYIAVIVISYHKIVNKYSNIKVYYTTEEYIKDKTKYELEKLRRKLRKVRKKGGADKETLEKKVRPKNVEHRYSNLRMITSYKLYCMRFVAKSVIINKYKPTSKKLSASRRRLIDKVVFLILSRNRAMLRKEMVYIVVDAKGNIQVITEERIVAMEFIADYIVNCGTRKNSIKVFFDEIVIIRERKSDGNDEIEEKGVVIIEDAEEFEDRLIFILDQLKSILKIMSHIRVIEYE